MQRHRIAELETHIGKLNTLLQAQGIAAPPMPASGDTGRKASPTGYTGTSQAVEEGSGEQLTAAASKSSHHEATGTDPRTRGRSSYGSQARPNEAMIIKDEHEHELQRISRETFIHYLSTTRSDSFSTAERSISLVEVGREDCAQHTGSQGNGCRQCDQHHTDSERTRRDSASRITVMPSPDDINFKDLRLFHHYLNYTKPYYPPGFADLWASEVPARAHYVPYLMHAILGLAGTYLRLQDPSFPVAAGIYHRQKAIAGVMDALAMPPQQSSREFQLDTALLANITLMLQSSYLPDKSGLLEFITTFQGCFQISGAVDNMPIVDLFASMKTEDNQAIRRASEFCIDPRIGASAILPLEIVLELCEYDAVQADFCRKLIQCAEGFSTSTLQGYEFYKPAFMTLASLPKNDLTSLLSSNEATTRILVAHFLALSGFLMLITHAPTTDPTSSPLWCHFSWIEDLWAEVELNCAFATLMHWPLKVARAVSSRYGQRQPSVLEFEQMVVNEPELFIVEGYVQYQLNCIEGLSGNVLDHAIANSPS